MTILHFTGIIGMLKSDTIDYSEMYIAAIQDTSFGVLCKDSVLYVNDKIYKRILTTWWQLFYRVPSKWIFL